MKNLIWEAEGARRALITGASGGIGEAFARILAAEGWELALVARNEEQLNRVAGVLRATHQSRVRVIPLDLSKPESGERLVEALGKYGMEPDVVINNAGFGLAGPADELPLDEQLRMIDLNVRAATELSLRFLPAMKMRGRGGLLNVASLAAFMPGPNMAVYFATKAYLLSFTEALAEEAAGSGLTISAFCPGPVRTSFIDRAGMRRTWMVRLMRPARADKAAWDGWQGFKEGRVIITPGLMTTLTAMLTRMTPRIMNRRITRLLLAPRRGRKSRQEATRTAQAKETSEVAETTGTTGTQTPETPRTGKRGDG